MPGKHDGGLCIRVRRGMVRTFQINQLFDSMTPLETLALVVSQHRGQGGFWWSRLGQDTRVNQRAEELLTQFHLEDVMHQATREMPYGKRRLLEIAIALACEPRVLLLDEPVAGVPAGEREELLATGETVHAFIDLQGKPVVVTIATVKLDEVQTADGKKSKKAVVPLEVGTCATVNA